MPRANPRRFERCVTKVKRSLKKYRRPGNAYAICKASQSNPAKWNPILPLDIWTATMTPQILSSIDKNFAKLGRKNKQPKKRKNLFGFLTKKRTTYHAHIVRPKATSKRLASYQGKAIYKTAEGDYATSIDRDSRHDSLADAKDFIRSFRTNLGKKRKNSKHNPQEAAREGYRGFHGHDSKTLTTIRTPIHEHKYLAGLGDLRQLTIVTPDKKFRVKVKFSKPYPILSMNEKRTQLFIEGGDQAVDLASFGIHHPHEKEVLGNLSDVYYFTTKDHLDPRDGGKAVYHHKYGKKRPTMVYDVQNKLIEFAGGGYTIPDEGIDG